MRFLAYGMVGVVLVVALVEVCLFFALVVDWRVNRKRRR